MRMRTLVAAALLILGSVLAPELVRASFGATLTNHANLITAATLQAPGTPQSSHPGGTSGTVDLSWTASGSGFTSGYQLVRATTPLGPFSIVICTGSGTSCTDTSAAYNAQYYYRAVATYQNWTSASNPVMALSLPPTSCFENTGGGSANCTLADLAVAGDGAAYLVAKTWPKNGKPLGSEWIECSFNPVTGGTTITSVTITLVYQTTATSGVNNANETFQLEVYDGATWFTFALTGANKATVAGQNVTARVNVTSVVDTPAKVAALKLRFEAAVNGATNFATIHDLIHVDVN